MGFNFGYGGKSWGNFISANGLNTSRFLDRPEFNVMHDRGNEENVFDRFDFKPSAKDSRQLELPVYALLVPKPQFLRRARRHGMERVGR